MTDQSKIKILVVEDDPDMMEQMKVYLESENYEVVAASTQKEAEPLIKPGAFSAAVLDLMMENPDSGFVLSHKIKKMDAKVPVIIVTSVTKETGFYFDKARDPKAWIKADAIIHKELRFEQLKSELKRLMGAGGGGHA
ncbi:MAG: response regulator [Elusimicrobia bacterium]|jgi:DNA-binding response OmpR family regulator|nr:response regulator [Elusimicrobiota bacterium]